MSTPHRIPALAAILLVSLLDTAGACTSLAYEDAANRVYVGRTLELAQELPYVLTYFPAKQRFQSQVGPTRVANYSSRHAIFGISLPVRRPTAEQPLESSDLKLLEGFNDQGLDYSVLAYPSNNGLGRQLQLTKRTLSAVDLGTWALGQYQNVDQVKEALAKQPFEMVPLAAAGNKEPPIHFVFHDRSGGSIVVEFQNGKQRVFDNPVGVMTNGPDFQWHLTNLSNYTHLSNIDQSSSSFGSLEVNQPDSGIATDSLPSSNTSVGRFVRAAYYAKFAERAPDQDSAVLMLANVMNNFDRPRGATVDHSSSSAERLDLSAFGPRSSNAFTTEYTSWTTLTDLERGRIYVRTHKSLAYVRFDLSTLSSSDSLLVVPLDAVDRVGTAEDSAKLLLAASKAGR